MDLQNELKKVKALAKTRGMKEEEAEKIFFELINMFNGESYETVGQWKKQLIFVRDFFLSHKDYKFVELLDSKIDNCETFSDDTLMKDILPKNLVN